MKRLHSLAMYTLVAPALTLCSSAVLADGSVSEDIDREQRSSQYDEGATQSSPMANRSDESARDQSRTHNPGYMSAAPANGMHASNLIGAEVTTTADEAVGPVNDLLIDEDGQVVAIVVGVGGFLGLGEKDVAIAWDDVTKSATSDEVKLQIDQTREELGSAPDFSQE